MKNLLIFVHKESPLIGFIAGAFVFSFMPGILHGFFDAEVFYFYCFVILFVLRLILKNNTYYFLERSPILLRREILFIFIVGTLFVYSFGIINQYHFNRFASGCFIVALFVFYYSSFPRRLLLIVLIGFYISAVIEEYSRVYFGVVFAAFLGALLSLSSEVGSGKKFSLGMRAIFFGTCLVLIGLSVFVVVGVRDAGLVESIFKGVSLITAGEGFDVNLNTAFILKVYPDEFDFRWFQHFQTLLLNPIPRFLWESKPIAFGAVLSADLYNIDIEDIFVNLGPGFFGEAYASGGWISVFITAVFFIVSARVLITYLRQRLEGPELTIMSLVLIALYAFVWRGDFLNAYINLILRVIPVLLYISTFKYSRR